MADNKPRVTFKAIAIYLDELSEQLKQHYKAVAEDERELRRYQTFHNLLLEFLNPEEEEE